MKRNLTFFLLFIFASTSMYAQYSIKGVVSDENEKGLAFANIVLMSMPDSNMLNVVTSTDRGAFAFSEVKEGKYVLKVMLLGFEDDYSEVFELNATTPSFEYLSTLETEAQLLDAVEVTAKVPLVEQRADRMVVNVSQSLTGLNGNLIDVLKKVPGMLVVNNRISLAGQSNIRILINGRPTDYMDVTALLQELPADNVEKIEVINQPGAEFEASGTGPIINIVLKQNKLFGTNGTFQVGVGRPEQWRYNTSVSLNHRQGSLNFYGSAGYNHGAWNETFSLTRRIGGDVYTQSTLQPSRPRTVRGNAGIDW
ncbi:MAG: carboxypeptidase regulatory-like domain-containing protein, partial [Bacteroidota bacterium]